MARTTTLKLLWVGLILATLWTNGCELLPSHRPTEAQSLLGKADPDQLLTSTVTGTPGSAGRTDGRKERARFNLPSALAIDRDNSLLIADAGNHALRLVDVDSTASTIANPSGLAGNQDGPFLYSRLQDPLGIAIASDRSVLIADAASNRIRRLTRSGRMETYAGSGEAGYLDGRLLFVRFNRPRGLAIDERDQLYIADSGNHCIRRISPDRITVTLAGTGEPGLLDGDRVTATFHSPAGIALDPRREGCFFVADAGNHAIRHIDESGAVVTIAGDGVPGLRDGPGIQARFNRPEGIVADRAGHLYIADTGNHCIRRIDPERHVTTLAGDGTAGSRDGQGKEARFRSPIDLVLTEMGVLLIADTGNHLLRSLAPRPAETCPPSTEE